MASTSKILGQLAPSATTSTGLYTVPAGTQTHVNIYVVNRGAAVDTFRIALRLGGATTATKHYIAYDQTINPGQSIKFDGITLNATDIITVYAGTNTLSFTATGIEII